MALCGGCQAAKVDRRPHDPQACGCLTCHGFYAATTDPQRIAAMLRAVPRGLLAIRTGAVSGLVVVDVDHGHGGMATLRGLVDRGLTPPTRYVRTGSGGLHLYYRHPGIAVPCDQGLRLGPGIDVRADGGYVVAPPSRHPVTGLPYTWADEEARVQEMAPALVSACVQPVQRLPAPTTPSRGLPARSAGPSPIPTDSWPACSTGSAPPARAGAA
ncbi:hypothetical protein Cs7R123_06480 [Catellatospora sp. TT07R-123]|uniref:bifunctional DNA primase/polymerase n=1 Tax=Catellatospora sp. TT07R-123 TaxID=2733863 RepID=UPI001B2DC538|nr:bifunctional DNA primase/polymerase [Catellatospora sp. TT07R-123]GHJ43306.1 hypothetical protein Cs7R123_06480 [Catellatospora sp. TT07R-123]